MIKSKLGFTLIEVLIVVAILAVLAMIAVPVIAGIVNKANIASDNASASEMTNAIERFASEYDFYRQDMLSDKVDLSNLDEAQNRVYKSLDIANKKEIEILEKFGYSGKAIDNKTNYPANPKTAKAVILNYVEDENTSSLIPKQENMAYWYCPSVGAVVVASPSSSVSERNAMIVNGKSADSSSLNEETEWTNLTEYHIDCDPAVHNGKTVPKGAQYHLADGTVLTEGMKMPSTVKKNDVYYYGEYKYRYSPSSFGLALEGWAVGLSTNYQKGVTCDSPLAYIAGEPVVKVRQTFSGCTTLKYAPKMPDTIIDMSQAFQDCTSLEYCPDIPNSVECLQQTFEDCDVLVVPPKVSVNVIDMSNAFYSCNSLISVPDLSNCTRLETLQNAFWKCYKLTNKTPIIIPASVTELSCTFAYCYNLKGTIEVNSQSLVNSSSFIYQTQVNALTGDSPTDIKQLLMNTKGAS